MSGPRVRGRAPVFRPENMDAIREIAEEKKDRRMDKLRAKET